MRCGIFGRNTVYRTVCCKQHNIPKTLPPFINHFRGEKNKQAMQSVYITQTLNVFGCSLVYLIIFHYIIIQFRAGFTEKRRRGAKVESEKVIRPWCVCSYMCLMKENELPSKEENEINL